MSTRPEKITIVAHGLRAGGGISVGRNLLIGLLSLLRDTQFQVFIPNIPAYNDIKEKYKQHSWIPYDSKYGILGRLAFDALILTRTIENFSPNVILCLGNVGVKSSKYPQILLVQDSHYFYPPSHYERETYIQNLLYIVRRMRLRRDLKRTAALLCQTKTAITRMKACYKFNGQTFLLPNAISIDSLAGENKGLGSKNLQHPNRFKLFYLTRYYPHKNIEILIDLFIKHRSSLKNVSLYLTIDENQHRKAKDILIALDRHDLHENIINLGPIKQTEVARYFETMDAMIMPTTLESFSGSYLEAMAFNCPILTSNLDFAHEVCANAALYFDPKSVDSIYAQLKKLMESTPLRQELVNNGKLILQRDMTTWIDNAKTLSKIINKVFQESATAKNKIKLIQ